MFEIKPKYDIGDVVYVFGNDKHSLYKRHIEEISITYDITTMKLRYNFVEDEYFIPESALFGSIEEVEEHLNLEHSERIAGIKKKFLET